MKDVPTFGLVSRTDVTYAIELARQVYSFLSEKGYGCLVEAELASKLNVPGVELKDLKVDLLIVVGGDGTILKTVRKLPRPETLVLGVKVGRTCFLGEVEPEELHKALDMMLNNKYTIEEAMKLSVAIAGEERVEAINEVVFVSTQPAKVINFEVTAFGKEVFKGLADGAIIATPTGSTAYALSAHGPAIDPEVEVFLMVPLNPLNLSSRPVVTSASKILKFRLLEPGPSAFVVVDGELVSRVGVEEEAIIEKASTKARFIRFQADKATFFERLKRLKR